MKLVYNGINLLYMIDTETQKIEQPPERCYSCDSKDKISKGCNLERCKNEK